MKKRTVVALAFAALLTFSPASGAAPPELGIEPHDFQGPGGQVVAAERGTLRVPENRSDAKSRSIEIGFIRFPATTKTSGNPIVYLAGGPGGSGSGTARGPRFPLFMRLRQVADVIAYDQRGTGLSSSIPRCQSEKSTLDPNEPLTRERALAGFETLARHCAKFWQDRGVDLDGYDTAESADDLEDLRQALGAEKLDLWGISYGTHLAYAALRRHPRSFGRVVLASSEGPDETVKLPSRTDAYLERVAELVRRDPELGAMVPDLVGLMRSVLDGLEKKPVKVRVVDPVSGGATEVVVGKGEIQFLTGFLIKNPDTLRNLPLAYLAMSRGDFSALAPYLMGFKSLDSMRGMPEAMDAASGISAARRARVERERETAVLGDFLNFPGPELARSLGVEVLPDSFRAPLTSSVPALFLSGSLDGRTYVESHREIAAGFENAIHVVIENAGHDLFMVSEEVGRRIQEFLRTGKTSTEAIRLDEVEFAKP